MITYDTMIEAINGLAQRGYTHDFNLKAESILLKENNGHKEINDFNIIEHHRFEGVSDPGDLSEIYAIQTSTGLKGILTDGYGISSNLPFEIIQKISSYSR